MPEAAQGTASGRVESGALEVVKEKGYEKMANRGNETAEERRKLPKNIRQIGETGRGDRVYLEDYAVTFLRQTKAAVLLGEICSIEGHTYYFVNGALEAQEGFPEDGWEKIYRETKEYFEGREVIGWFERTTGGTWKLPESAMDVYLRRFEGENPVLILFDEDEEEEGVFLAEEEGLKKQRGYYIYYEKNQMMQDYMILKNTGRSVEKEAQISDSAIQNFRRIVEKKTEKIKPSQGKLVYGAGAFLILTIMAVGLTVVQNYDKMKEMEQTVEDLRQTSTEASGFSIQVSAGALAGTETETESSTQTEMTTPVLDTRLPASITAAMETEKESGASDEMTEKTTDAAETKQTESEADWTDGTVETVTTEWTLGTGNSQQTEKPDETETSSAAEAVTRAIQAEYVIKEGDTLADVCEMYYGSLDMIQKICQVNNIKNPNQILPGQKIVLP